MPHFCHGGGCATRDPKYQNGDDAARLAIYQPYCTLTSQPTKLLPISARRMNPFGLHLPLTTALPHADIISLPSAWLSLFSYDNSVSRARPRNPCQSI